MRPVMAMALAGGLLVGQAAPARAQNGIGSFGGYPAGITTGSAAPYGPYTQGFIEERYGYPFTYAYTAAPMYDSAYVTPGTSYYSSGYAGYAYPGSYATTYRYSTPAYSYSVPAYGYATSYGYPVYGYRRGLVNRVLGRWW